MFGIGGFELFIILVFGFLIFGPEKLPEIAKTVGKGIAHFRQAQDEMNEVIKSTDIYDPNSDEPFKDPMEALDKLARHQEEKKKSQQSASVGKKAAGEKPAADGADETSDDAPPRQESFTERKARYERERAARKAAEQKEAEEKAAEEAAAEAAKQDSGEEAVEQKAAGEPADVASAQAEPVGIEHAGEVIEVTPAIEKPQAPEEPSAADEPSAQNGEDGE